MKYDNELRLARLASANVRNGGASALVLANRLHGITGSTEGQDIVSRVYSHPAGRAVWECRECGCEYLTPDGAAECCNED